MVYRCFNIEYNITNLDIEEYAQSYIGDLTDEEIDNIVDQIEDSLPHELYFELTENVEFDLYEVLGELIAYETDFVVLGFTAEPLANERLPIDE